MASADLNTGTTPASKPGKHAGSQSVTYAPAGPTLGTSLTPEQYRTRKVALITGKLAFALRSLPFPFHPLVTCMGRIRATSLFPRRVCRLGRRERGNQPASSSY